MADENSHPKNEQANPSEWNKNKDDMGEVEPKSGALSNSLRIP
jgi:hypothetical protein